MTPSGSFFDVQKVTFLHENFFTLKINSDEPVEKSVCDLLR